LKELLQPLKPLALSDCNVCPATLGPRGNNFHDVISSLGALQGLGMGIGVEDVNGQKITVAAASSKMAALVSKDLPHITSCRLCLVKNDERHAFDYGIIQNGLKGITIRSSSRCKIATTSRPIKEEKFYCEIRLSSLQTPLSTLLLRSSRPIIPAACDTLVVSRR
jgi:hypothetical protein